MNTNLSNRNLACYTPEYVLADWQQAISTFYRAYQQLLTYVDQTPSVGEQALILGNSAHLGQCPVDQLVQLITAMQAALVNLLQEMNQDAEPSQLPTMKYSKLATHTRILTDLSQQAQYRFYLVTQPSS